MQAPPGELCLVLMLSPDASQPDALGVVDVRANSSTCATLVHTVAMLNSFPRRLLFPEVLAYLRLDICIREPKVMKHATVELEEGAALNGACLMSASCRYRPCTGVRAGVANQPPIWNCSKRCSSCSTRAL